MRQALTLSRQIVAHPAKVADWLTWFAVLATACALGLGAAAHFLPVSDWQQYSDCITPLLGHVLIAGLSAVAAVVAKRNTLAIMAAGVAAAFLLPGLWAYSHRVRELWPTAVTSPTAPLRVYALNTWDDLVDLPRLELAVMAVNADVVVLAEVGSNKVALLQRLKQHFPYQMTCPLEEGCQMALLSKLPVIKGAAVRINDDVPPIAWARIDATARGLGEITVIGTHVHRPTRAPRLHARQMRALTSLALSAKGPLIVAGDFNTGVWTASFSQMLRVTGLVPSSNQLPTWPAYPVAVPQVALDHVLVSRDLTVVRSGVGPFAGSDHAPVFAEITLNSAAGR